MLPFIEDGPLGAVELAARCAFWSMDRGTVISFAAGIVVGDAASHAEVLFSAVQRVLRISDAERLLQPPQRSAAADGRRGAAALVEEPTEAAAG